MVREFGENSHYGGILALHSLIMVLCLIHFTILIYYFSLYSLLIMGGFITAVSPLILAVSGSTPSILMFAVLISIGEAIFAPRLIDYSIAIAPEGREGSFLAVASCPFALGSIYAGVSSGFLLEEYCPEDGNDNCWVMWLFIGLTTLIAPLLMVVFRNVLEEPELKDKSIY
mmetsp:Transcript_21821/g.3623  ORF Transcript_21821/g.3623 Transcript_21821/m.3623 type:complete len:171 (+) Transcript_21821:825-1337(+)